MFDIGSIVGGIGNFLGGLFGQKKKDDPQSQPQSQPQQPRQPQQPLGIASMPSLNIPSAQSQQAPSVQPQQLSGVTTAPKAPVAPTAPTPNFFTDAAKNVGDFTAQANDALYGGLTRGAANIANSIGTGFNQDETAKRTEDFMRSIGQSSGSSQSNLAIGTNRDSTAGRIGQAIGSTEKTVADTVPYALMPEVGALSGLSTIGKVGVNAGGGALIGFGSGMANGGSLKDDLTGAGINAALGGTLTAAVSKFAPKFLGSSAEGDAIVNGRNVEGKPVNDPSSPITASPTTDKPAAITSPNPDHPTNAPAIAPPEAITPSVQSAGEPPAISKPVLQAAEKPPVQSTVEPTPISVQNEVDTKLGLTSKDTTDSALEKLDKEYEAGNLTEDEYQRFDNELQDRGEKNGTLMSAKSDSIPVSDSTAAKVDDTQPAGVNPDAVAQVGVGKRAFSSKENIIRATNTESGNTLADGIVKAEDGHLNYTGKAMSQLHDAFKLNKADFETAWRVQEGDINPKTVSPAISDAANQMKQVMGDIHKSAENAGVVSGDLGDTYMPHMYAKDKAGNPIMSNEASSDAKQFGNLEKERTSNDANYQRTPEALQHYIDRSSQRISQAEQFGSKNEVAKDLISKIKTEGGDSALAEKAFSNYYDPLKTDSVAAKVSTGIRTAQSALQLPLAAVSHATQGANIAVDAGIIPTLKNTLKTIFKPGEAGALAERAGVTTPQSLGHYSNEYTSFGGKLANKVTAPLLKPVMKFNRTVAANTYADKAASMAAKGDTQGLRDLGVQGDIGSTLTEDQILQAARGGTKRTMFNNSAADTPVYAETPAGKAIWQYRGAYAGPQTGFIYNRVLKPALEGKLAPLARYATVGTAGAAIPVMVKNAINSAASQAITGNPTPTHPNDIASVAKTVGPEMAGLPGTIASSLINYGPSNPVGTTAGIVAPIAGEAVKAVNAVGQSAKDKSFAPLERYGLGKIPIIGQGLAAKYAPTQAQKDNAQTAAIASAAGGAPAPASSGNPITDIANGVGNFVNGIFNPAPPDPVNTEMTRLGTDGGAKFSKNETNALASKDLGPTAHNLINDSLYQSADDQAKTAMLRSVLNGSATKGVNTSLSDGDKQALLDAKVLTPTDKKAWLDDNKNNASYTTAMYNNAVANKGINPQVDNNLSNKNGLQYKAVAAQVDEKYNTDPQLKADYASTTQNKFTALLNPKNASYDVDAAQTLYQYDQERVAAGLPAKYDMSVVNKLLSKAASSGTGTPKSFTFANLPTSLISSSGAGGAGPIADGAPLFKPIPSLQAPTAVAIPKGRSISVTKV